MPDVQYTAQVVGSWVACAGIIVAMGAFCIVVAGFFWIGLSSLFR